MKGFKGTKGEWRSDIDYVFVDDPDIIGNIICENPINDYSSSINWEANARLIVCAPEMLKMIKKIIDSDFIDSELYREAKKLIKKATK